MSTFVNLTAYLAKSSKGHDYVAAHVRYGVIRKYVQELRGHLGDENFRSYVRNLARRNGKNFLMTIVDPAEYGRVKTRIPDNVHLRSDVELIGLGVSKLPEAAAYYVIADAPAFQRFRAGVGLDEKDFHITLAFRRTDIHGVRKNRQNLLSAEI